MDNNNLNGHHLGSRITPEMLGLVKKSAVEKKISINLVDVIANRNGEKVENEIKQNGNSKQKEDDDIEIVDEIVGKTIKKENDLDSVKNSKMDENNGQKVKTSLAELDDEETGFPNYLNGWVIRGCTIPINKKTWTEIDIDGNDAILDCPSQVVPLMIKKPNVFPVKEETKSIKSETKNEVKKEIKEEIKTKDEIKKETVKEDGEKKDVTNKEDKKNDENNKVNDQTNENEKKPSLDKNSASLNKDNKLTMLTIPDFYKSSVGSFLMGIGLRRCQEVSLKDSVRQTQKLIRKEGELEEHIETLKDQQEQYEDCKSVNSIYTFRNLKCSMCDFKTESELIMQGHLSIPHISNRKEFKCNFCMFVTRDARTIVYHFSDQHKKPCNIEMPPQLYTCPTCNYESNQKAKAANHMAKCVKVFNGDKVQQTLDIENEFPTITPKPITQDDLKLYETTIQALKPVVMNPGLQIPYVPGLPRGLQQQILLMQQQQFARQKIKQPKALVNQRNNINNIRPNNLANMANILNSQSAIAALAASGVNGANLINNLNFAKANAPQLYHMLQTGSHAQLLNLPAKQNILPSSSKIPHLNNRTVPPISSATMVQKNINNIKPTLLGKNFKETSNGGKPETFVICEICDGYIKDLEQLRTHMQWIHKVKIHPKMLASRPPLNCQKCQWRFFTDQGLERHLLGAHGLVTTNMQDLVDQFEDGGRCTICGRAFTSKLVAHMNQVHKVTLRPAHLSYKCTVCSATFNLYRLFENHVYMVHSGSVKRINEDQTNQLNKKSRTQTIEIKPTAINGS